MKIVVTVRNVGVNEPLGIEEYNWPDVSSLEEAKNKFLKILENFNQTLRPYEKARELVSIVEGGMADVKHQWEKQNLSTICDKHSMYDIMRCRLCGCMGKRYGVGEGGIQLDNKFRTKKWQSCPGSQA
jgi:nitrous oxide reductase accessory protein NosL